MQPRQKSLNNKQADLTNMGEMASMLAQIEN